MTEFIDLNGTWQLSWRDTYRGGQFDRVWEVPVPGELHEILLAQGIIEEPSVGLNCLKARWVEEMLWLYRRAFAIRPLQVGERAWLHADCLELAATILLNGKSVGQHANVYRPCRIDITDAIMLGENMLEVQLESGVFDTANKPVDQLGMTGLNALTKRQWMRQVQSTHGWDWSTRMLNVGITGGMRIEIASVARWESMSAFTTISDDFQQGAITVRVMVEGLEETPVDGELTLTIAETGQQVRTAVSIAPGEQRLEVTVPVAKPALWWPVGHGAQPRYTVSASLLAGDMSIGSGEKRVGFRKVYVRQDAHPTGGQYFIVEINDKPIFCKGGNWVPPDMILSRVDRARYQTLIERALEANCNLLRIWGGGAYAHDDFYDLCDEQGILVWQEFIFACSRYPGNDEGFYKEVSREATYQTRRLAHHPSLIIWCGNNEIEWGYYSWNWDTASQWPDHGIFHHLLPAVVRTEDPTRYYQPSSPYSPDFQHPNIDDSGDQHPWSIGFANGDFRDYRAMQCRFPNEGGILGPNALPTVLACLPEGMRYPASFAWDVHENGFAFSPGKERQSDIFMRQWLGMTMKEMSIADYVYWGGLLQGLGLTEYINNFRRRMFDSASAIFWMYNDCWPTTHSWTIVDYYLRRTPAFWPVRRAFAPVIVVITREDDRVRVYGVNEGDTRQTQLRYGIMALAGSYPLDESKTVTLPANSSTILADFPAAQWDTLGQEGHIAFALLSDAMGEIARTTLFLPTYQQMQWSPATVNVTLENGKAIFSSNTFAWRVCLDLDGEQPLPDNFFDVYPGIPTILDWPETLGKPVVLRVGNLV